MMIALVLVAQAVAGPQLPAPSRPRSDAPCPVVNDSDDVVVCGRSNDRYRLKPLPQGVERQGLPKAELNLGSAALAAEAEQAALAGGQQSQRLMVRLTLPLGRKKAR